MVFVLDNYDSFTYNLVQYMGELGAEMIIRRNDELTPDRGRSSPSRPDCDLTRACTPQDAGISIDLIQHFARPATRADPRGLPGASGDRCSFWRRSRAGTEADARQNQPGGARWQTIFTGIPSTMTCTRYHSLIVAEEGLPEELGDLARELPTARPSWASASPVSHRGRPVPPRERADRAWQADHPEFPEM